LLGVAVRDLDRRENILPKFVIERDLPGAGSLTDEQFQKVAQKSCDVLRALGPDIQWVQSYVSDEKLYCVYIAKDENLLHEHAERGGFPLTRISRVERMLDPTSEEGAPEATA
jgi:hypothetical protein